MKSATNNSILVINTGSSSIKFQLFAHPDLHLLARGKVSNINNAPLFNVVRKSQTTEEHLPEKYTYKESLNYILNWLKNSYKNITISAFVHRVVHGGDLFTQSVRVTPEIISILKTLCPLAPLHQPHNLIAIEMLTELKPNITQIACFDTAFHAGHERLFTEYALPETMRNKGIHRYGFHGLSYEWVAYNLNQHEPYLVKKRIIVAHLGNGASLCAMQNGVSIDTTMGLTALDGLPMGTRCGSIDPGIITYLIREFEFSADKIENMLYQESGLKGLSGWTNDVRLLQESSNPDAKFALDYFCMKVSQYIGMMAVSLGGIDAIVFTGGIGENSELIRQQILRRLEFLKPFEMRVVKANEEQIMALHAINILNAK